MNEELTSAILSKPGRKLISHFPRSKTTALDIRSIAIKAGITQATAYRIIKTLSKWDNIKSIETYTTYAPLILYYIGSRNFMVIIKSKGTEVKVIE